MGIEERLEALTVSCELMRIHTVEAHVQLGIAAGTLVELSNRLLKLVRLAELQNERILRLEAK